MSRQGPQPESVYVEYHPVRHIDFDLKPFVPPASVAFVQANGINNASSTTLSIAFTNPVSAGDLLVIAAGAQALDGVANTVSASDSQGNTWTQVGGYAFNAGNNYGLTLFYTLGSAGADTLTLTASGGALNFFRLLTAEFSGVTTLDKHAAATGSVYPLDSGPMVTTSPNEVIFGWGVADNGTTVPGAGFTIARTQAIESTEYMLVSATGTYNAVFPGDGANSDWISVGATFR